MSKRYPFGPLTLTPPVVPDGPLPGQQQVTHTPTATIVQHWYKGVKTRLVIPARFVVRVPDSPDFTAELTSGVDMTGLRVYVIRARRLDHKRHAAHRAHARKMKRGR